MKMTRLHNGRKKSVRISTPSVDQYSQYFFLEGILFDAEEYQFADNDYEAKD